MGFMSRLFASQAESIVLIDIGSASVSGAYARLHRGSPPMLYYSTRVPIRTRNKHANVFDMEQALLKLVQTLLIHGAPVFAKAVGSGTIDRVLVSIASPWQETHTSTERMTRTDEFRFTHSVMDSLLKKATSPVPGHTQTNQTVVAILLNGYKVHDPFDKYTRSAEVVALSASVSDDVVQVVVSALRHAFHSDHIELTAFAPVAYTVLHTMYPHEKDLLIMDVTGEATDLALVRNELLVEVASIPYGLNTLRRAIIDAGINTASNNDALRVVEDVVLTDTKNNVALSQHVEEARNEWLRHLAQAFNTLTVRYALPRAILLLADESTLPFLKRILNDAEDFQKLWLSEDTLPILAIDSGQLAHRVIYRAEAHGDTFLSLLALYAAFGYTAATIHT